MPRGFQAVPLDTPHQLKVKRLNSEQKWLWVVILLLAYRSPAPGKLYIDNDLPILDEDLAWEASIPLDELKAHLTVLADLRMILRDKDNVICLVNQTKEIKGSQKLEPIITSAETENKPGISPDEMEIAKGMGYTAEEWIMLKKSRE